ncbi:MAG: hypothetical protein DKINENOH_04473 [bacterium]|nr:hypothetical protein [bacterium]
MPDAQGSITFVNESVYVVTIQRGDTPVIDLGPTESSTQSTTAGEIWKIIDKDTRRLVDTVTGTAGNQTYRIKFKRGRGEPVKSGSGGD